MLLEVYARVEGFENLYAVSNLGNVINIEKNGQQLKKSNSHGYLVVGFNDKKTYRIHRLVANAFLDKIEGKNLVDHKDGNRTNNTITNLRYCNSTENNQNSKMFITNTSGVKGVCYDKTRKKWAAKISINNKTKLIGRYDTLEEAKTARQNKAFEIFGEFLNDCEK